MAVRWIRCPSCGHGSSDPSLLHPSDQLSGLLSNGESRARSMVVWRYRLPGRSVTGSGQISYEVSGAALR